MTNERERDRVGLCLCVCVCVCVWTTTDPHHIVSTADALISIKCSIIHPSNRNTTSICAAFQSRD